MSTFLQKRLWWVWSIILILKINFDIHGNNEKGTIHIKKQYIGSRCHSRSIVRNPRQIPDRLDNLEYFSAKNLQPPRLWSLAGHFEIYQWLCWFDSHKRWQHLSVPTFITHATLIFFLRLPVFHFNFHAFLAIEDPSFYFLDPFCMIMAFINLHFQEWKI